MKFIFALFITIGIQLIMSDVFANTLSEWNPITSQSAITALGVEIGEPITNGFIFIDGRYIPPPYVVKREGNGVFINERLIRGRIPWPIVPRTAPRSITDLPVLPETITEKSTQDDRDVIDYLSKTKAYYTQKYGEKEIVKWMTPVYEALPCVEKVLPMDSVSIRIIWKDGRNHDGLVSTLLISTGRPPEEWTPEKIIEEMNFAKELYEKRLKKGDYYFIGTPSSNAGRITGTKEGAIDILTPLISILETSQTSEEVFTRFNDLKRIHLTEGSAQAFFENRDSITPELKQRVEVLRSEQQERQNRHRKSREEPKSKESPKLPDWYNPRR